MSVWWIRKLYLSVIQWNYILKLSYFIIGTSYLFKPNMTQMVGGFHPVCVCVFSNLTSHVHISCNMTRQWKDLNLWSKQYCGFAQLLRVCTWCLCYSICNDLILNPVYNIAVLMFFCFFLKRMDSVRSNTCIILLNIRYLIRHANAILLNFIIKKWQFNLFYGVVRGYLVFIAGHRT